MATTETLKQIRAKYRSLLPALNRRARRRWAAVEAQSLGRGGICAVAKATGMSRTTIYVGLRELRQGNRKANKRGRRKELAHTDPGLLPEEATRGDSQTHENTGDLPCAWRNDLRQRKGKQ